MRWSRLLMISQIIVRIDAEVKGRFNKLARGEAETAS